MLVDPVPGKREEGLAEDGQVAGQNGVRLGEQQGPADAGRASRVRVPQRGQVHDCAGRDGRDLLAEVEQVTDDPSRGKPGDTGQ